MTTAAEFAALLAEYRAAESAFNELDAEEGSADHLAAQERSRQAFRAMLEARPTDPLSMCRQLLWIANEAMGGDIEPVLRHVAEQLERLAGRAGA